MIDCSICLDGIVKSTQSGCSHEFCLKCIIAWIGTFSSLANIKCPLCRSLVYNLEFNARKFYETNVYFLVHAYQLVKRNPNKSKQELYYLLQNEFDELDMFIENFDELVIFYVCLQGFLASEYEFIKSLF